MNRIILIGNGFDLAHGMETSYNNFLNDYWKSAIEQVQNSAGQAIYENEDIVIKNVPLSSYSDNDFPDFQKSIKRGDTKIEFKNQFLSNITEKNYLKNWVDIENEYYSELKKNMRILGDDRNSDSIEKLNSDFNRIKSLLNEYLIRIEKEFDKTYHTTCKRIISMIGHKIYSPIKYKDVSDEGLNTIANIEFEKISDIISSTITKNVNTNELERKKQKIIRRIGISPSLTDIKKLLQSDGAMEYFDLIPDEILFLNFNYTYTEHLYNNPEKFDNYYDNKNSKTKINHIHGTTEIRDNNPMIFGFGDELDDDYSSIEKLNDNRFLENIKSINYLETDNYKKLLEFVNQDSYQIFVFGHSCGISDRTLLNTLFENKNCVSIKVFYHQIDNKSDNYSDIVKNISRNFNNKAKMREVVVNKNYCEPMN